MNIEQVREYTLSLPGVTEDQAFGEDILNFRLEGKIFISSRDEIQLLLKLAAKTVIIRRYLVFLHQNFFPQ